MTIQQTFDQYERERIRYAVLRYKLSHGIGAPELATRISEANPHHPTVNQRRVSRFLAKKHDPDPIFYGWCDTFLKSVPLPPDPIFQLAKGLINFCGDESKNCFGFSGEYTLSIYDTSNNKNPEIFSKLTAVPDDGFWRLKEKAIQKNEIWDGVLTNARNGSLAVLKERLTSTTKIYSLSLYLTEADTIRGSALWRDNVNEIKAYQFELESIP
jgi:hypothetical protein